VRTTRTPHQSRIGRRARTKACQDSCGRWIRDRTASAGDTQEVEARRARNRTLVNREALASVCLHRSPVADREVGQPRVYEIFEQATNGVDTPTDAAHDPKASQRNRARIPRSRRDSGTAQKFCAIRFSNKEGCASAQKRNLALVTAACRDIHQPKPHTAAVVGSDAPAPANFRQLSAKADGTQRENPSSRWPSRSAYPYVICSVEASTPRSGRPKRRRSIPL